MTNAHVVWPFDSARVVFPDGSEFHDVPVRGWDLLADLAVLGPINRPTGGLALSDGEDLPIGANLFLIGYPAETEKFPQPTIVRGLLSRVREWESVGITYLQADATIIGGQSGGALVSEAGHVIGISGLRFTEANFAMVASASDFIPRVRELIEGRDPSGLGDRGALLQGGTLRHGVTLENYWSQRAYLINEPPGALIDFELTGDNDGGFTIYDPYGFELLAADNGSTGAEGGAYTIERDEPHFLVVWQWPETTGDFTLKSSHRLTQIHDPDDGRQLQVSQPARGNIDFPTDLDYFLVDLTEGEVIEVIAESSVADTFLTIDYVGALDTQMIVDDDSGAGLLGLDSAIIYRAPHTGRYFVVVSDANYSAPGGYVIKVKRAGRNAVPTTTTWASLFGESVATEPPSAQSAFGLAELRSAFTGLPDAFEEFDPAAEGLSLGDLGLDEIYFSDGVLFASADPWQVLFAVSGEMTELERFSLDAELSAPAFLDVVTEGFVSELNVDQDVLHQSGLMDVSRVGEASGGVWFDTTLDGIRLRMDLIMFRQGNIAAIVYSYIYSPDFLSNISTQEAARMLEKAIVDYLSVQ